MSADLITYIIVGPVNLKCSKKLRAAILEKAGHVIGAAQQYLKDPDFDWGNDKFIGDFQQQELAGIASLDAEVVLGDLFDLWKGKFTDSSSRVLLKTKDTPAAKVVVAGSETWGDEPSGQGFTTIRDAEFLGMLKPLGIR